MSSSQPLPSKWHASIVNNPIGTLIKHRVIGAVQARKSAAQAAAMVGMPDRTAHNLVTKFKQTGSTHAHPCSSQPLVVDNATKDHQCHDQGTTWGVRRRKFQGFSSPHPGAAGLRTAKRPLDTLQTHQRQWQAPNGPAIRRKDHLKTGQEALVGWHAPSFLARYSMSSFTDVGILPDKILTSLASKQIRTLEEMAEKLRVPWMFSQRHGEEIIEVLKRVDQAQREANAKARKAKKVAKQQAKAAEDATTPRTPPAPRAPPKRKAAPRETSPQAPPRPPLAVPPGGINQRFHRTTDKIGYSNNT
ncbi:hypothetical protein DFH09DRAFT_1075836 [Mycena vulgaris]|nr:hypothetical protein DFH09DRAFT_1075836 [Mycena vulgaris]